MNVVSAICFLVFIIMILSFLRKDTDVFSPARLFIIIWSFAIGLTELKLSRFQVQWSVYSWLMLGISLFSFLTGIFFIYVINIGKPLKKITVIRSTLKTSAINSDMLFNYTMFLFTAYVVSFIASYLMIGYVPLFTRFPGLYRVDWGIFGFGLFIQGFPSIIFLIMVYYLFTQGKPGKKLLLAIVFLITFITYATLLQRYYVIFAIVVSAVTLYYASNVMRFRNVLVLFAALIAIMYSMMFIRLSGTIVNYLYYLSHMKYSVKYAVFTEPYMYVVMNLENFAHAVEKLQRFTYGTYTFDFLLALTGIKHPLAEYLRLSDFPDLITANYNTYTSFFIYYRDFGVFGLAAVPMTLGMLFSAAYYRMRRKPDINTVAIYSIFTFVILFSFFVPLISFLHFAFNLFLIYMITKAVLKYRYEPG